MVYCDNCYESRKPQIWLFSGSHITMSLLLVHSKHSKYFETVNILTKYEMQITYLCAHINALSVRWRVLIS